jgi:hypothetical protein
LRTDAELRLLKARSLAQGASAGQASMRALAAASSHYEARIFNRVIEIPRRRFVMTAARADDAYGQLLRLTPHGGRFRAEREEMARELELQDRATGGAGRAGCSGAPERR